MSIPVPHLDDRRFQDLVDDAKRRIADRCPEWTDHNVSDPGVTLIELFAQMVDETLFRLNRVPETLLLMMMNAVGIRLQPARSARTRLTFWLAAPTRFWEAATQDEPLLAGAGVEVSTERTATVERVAFRTTEDLRAYRAEVVGRHLVGAPGPRTGDPRPAPGTEHVEALGTGVPVPGAAFLVELARALPGCAVQIDLDCEPNRGSGVLPDDPPLVWEAWGRGTWQVCEVDRDTTGGLNRPGAVYLHVPSDHTGIALPGTATSAWLRCRLATSRPGQSSYERSPSVGRITARTIGVSVDAIQADQLVRGEVVGVSDGTYGQAPFVVRNVPVVEDDSGGPLLLAGQDPEPWTPVTSFEASRESDRHYLLDRVGGEIRLGVAVRQSDGRMRRYAAVPPAAAALRLAEYRVGGGVRGNVRATSLRVLRSAVPHVRSVENRHAATGGVDPETVEQAMARVPLFLRQRTRAVTVADFAQMARDASGAVARAHAVPEGDPETSMSVRVLVVPELAPDAGLGAPLRTSDLTDVPQTMTDVARYLDDRRLVGVRVLVSPPRYVPCRATVRLAADPGSDAEAVAGAATSALYRLLHPLLGGEHGTGWPFGTDVQVGDLYAVLHRVPGVARVESVMLTDGQDHETSRLAVPRNGLPLSLGHTVVLT
ncbi:putative baseplate assembly protein [Actinotalea sp. K2]|uniref:putative baseplate assembly protein n=1 Tax=Actinotalea sp. K2 TaxID=2939438 RepID=UPI002016C5E3|nr:putative baseplate assembly protein [Actinotalea sp. K2]MCL3860414.1 putative baseplate assembly protein [Actinotalea sp. K2]